MGLVSRVAEEAGIATVCVATGLDLISQVNPPRTVFVNFPMGNNFGRRGDHAMQLAIMRQALSLLETVTAGGELVTAPYEWHEEFESKFLRWLDETRNLPRNQKSPKTATG